VQELDKLFTACIEILRLICDPGSTDFCVRYLDNTHNVSICDDAELCDHGKDLAVWGLVPMGLRS